MSVLSIDVGTSMIKSVVFDAHGREIAVARVATQVHRPHPGWAEQDMDAVWDAVARTVRQVVARLRETGAAPLWLITFTAQGDGCWLVDPQGRPTGPAVLWSDGRAAGIVDTWKHTGVLEEAFRRNGSLTFAGLPNALLTWFEQHDPDRLARSDAALTAAGWLFLRFTGRRVIDESDASAPFLDHATGDYDQRIIDLFGLAKAQRLLPRVVGDDRRIAEITAEASEQLGVPAGLPVVMAPYDIAATARGIGVVNPGQACAVLGTTLCVEAVRTAVDTSGEPSGVNIAYRGRERVLRAFPTLSGTEVLNWTADTLGLPGPKELVDLAMQAPPGAADLGFLPYLSPAGERAPFLDPRARGTFWGLSLEHSRAHVARSVLEGLSLAVRDSLTASRTEVGELRLCGGGANSDDWCRLIADVTGVPTARSTDTELGAKGAFLTGLVLTGAESSMHRAADTYVHMSGHWEPDPERSALYADRYDSFVNWREMARSSGWQPHPAPAPGEEAAR
ncbi:FGGY family carbohydrate kinase [Streptomyces sp. Da 82-17]|uniref:FGGY family carbohydrate kinase n=1 Tax=Streptomyces sp. Da 82-17 TaxID=3377116 RepID=UPI0038D3793E